MLNFKTPELEDKNWISECYSYAHSMNCEYTFGNIYLWRAAYKSLVAHYDGFVICRWGSNHDIKYSLPIAGAISDRLCRQSSAMLCLPV